MASSTRTGSYGGRSAETRRAERRERLVGAAGDLWSEQGWAAVSMRGVCARAELTDRYFYENFDDRDALLVTVWGEERDQLVTLVLAAFTGDRELLPGLRAAVSAVVRRVQGDPERARIILGDNAGCPPLEQHRRATLQTFTDLLVELARPLLAPGTDENALRMSVLIGVGGFAELLTAWNTGTIPVDPAYLVDHVMDVATALLGRYLVTAA